MDLPPLKLQKLSTKKTSSNMRKHISLITLGLTLRQSFLVRCGPEELTHIDQRFSTPEMVNSFSFVPEHPSHDVIGTVNESNLQIPSSVKITPYAAFFRESKEVMDRSTKEGVKTLANQVILMISNLSPTSESWESWLQRNQGTVEEFIKTAYTALYSDEVCDEEERTWIVGILSAISKYMPPDQDKMTGEEKIERFPWGNQVALEIKATKEFEPFMTKRFESLWLRNEHISANEISKDLDELLQRANMFGIYDLMKEEEIPCKVSAIYELISKHLMKSKLPEEENEISGILNDIKDFFKNTDLFGWEGQYCEQILQHILKHSPQTRKIFSDLLQDYTFFRQVHFPFAKKDMIEYLKQETEMKDLNNYIKVIKGWKEEVTCQLLPSEGRFLLERFTKKLNSQELDRPDHHKFIAAFYLIFPSEAKYLRGWIEKGWVFHKIELENLKGIWSKVFPDGFIPDANFGEYQWMFLVKNPSCLERVMLYQAGTKMKTSTQPGVSELGDILENGKLTSLSASDHYKKVMKILQEVDDITSANEVYRLCLEFIRHIVSLKKEYATAFLQEMESSKEFRITIQKAIKTFKKPRKDSDPTERSVAVTTSNFYTFLQKVENIFTIHPQQKIKHVMMEKVAAQLQYQPNDFNLIIGGQPFKFKFNATC
ncbi:uncharacterized protein MELLADRAFT_61768 [Melampsora larici-populina 98AG31]|uniref:Uncharacterized protein n=1 Tax=Melampsora larici-populina (strain 98AG31 / pathotype 3-4-7) TaxID=747676 RepID=F4RGD0_MELLP|nr:uncharacterized protein MELLADRAFT_61768 [Melampsora larici-populina 98AG31]EGG08482.1 hypothetical protein MELLADRAFT_61768 [Melampsora larici-populina 98AG31]